MEVNNNLSGNNNNLIPQEKKSVASLAAQFEKAKAAEPTVVKGAPKVFKAEPVKGLVIPTPNLVGASVPKQANKAEIAELAKRREEEVAALEEKKRLEELTAKRESVGKYLEQKHVSIELNFFQTAVTFDYLKELSIPQKERNKSILNDLDLVNVAGIEKFVINHFEQERIKEEAYRKTYLGMLGTAFSSGVTRASNAVSMVLNGCEPPQEDRDK